MPEQTYTTHDIARFCGVYPSSVVNWIASGKLKAYATPGGHHRVTHGDLVAFMERFKIPLPKDLSRRARVLIVDDDKEFAKVVARAFDRRRDEFETAICHDGIEALISIGQQPPELVVLDIVLPKMDGMRICRVLKSKPKTQGIKIVAVSGKKPPFDEKNMSAVGIDAFFRKPLDLDALMSKASELLNVGSSVRAAAG